MSDPTASSAQRPPSPAEFRKMLDELTAEGERLRAKAAQPAPDLREMLGVPDEGKVTISRDELGLIDGVTFEQVDGKRAAADQLLTQLNLALFAGTLPGWGAAASGLVTDSGELAPELLALMASLESGQSPEPTIVTNDLKTVTVGAVNGDIVSIDCTVGFLEAATDEVLEAEIVRAARQAAIESDVLGRYKKRSEG